MRTETRVERMVADLLEVAGAIDRTVPLLDLGADSLVFVELSHQIKVEFGVLVSVQQLFEDVVTINAIGRWVDENQPTADSVAANIRDLGGSFPLSLDVHPTMDVVSRVERMVADLLEVAGAIDRTVPLLDLGADSLVFVELSHQIKVEFGVLVSVQQLFEDVVTINAIGRWVDENQPTADASTVPSDDAKPSPQLMQAQPKGSLATPSHSEATSSSARLSEIFEDVLCNNRRMAERTDLERAQAYPLWVERSDGPFLWDVDGRQVIDLAMGYGAHLFGHNPVEVMEAIRNQLERGIHLGAEVEQTGRLAALIREITGNERVNFCVTGTEAVFTALRLARAFTQRSKVVILKESYHGHSDATLVGPRPGARKAFAGTPTMPGVSANGAEDVLVAAWDDPGLPSFLRQNREEIAAVLVEPLQNQNPDHDLSRVVRELRHLTTEIGALLIFDEILTGFRFAVGGFQEIFDVRADLVLYGKVVAAGMPLSVVAGRAEVLDLVDGGPWTKPMRADEDRLTFTAGTYAKHPLSTAAGFAVLSRLNTSGRDTLRELNDRGDALRTRIEAALAPISTEIRVIGRGSFFRLLRAKSTSFAHSGRLFQAFRRALLAEGVYVAESGNCFLSTAHSEAEVDEIVAAVGRAAKHIRGEEMDAPTSSAPTTASVIPDISIAFFGVSHDSDDADIYENIVSTAEIADSLGLTAVWLPERHFDGFAGFSPNPAVIGAMLAMRTGQIGIRAGSSVLPLHSAASVAEDWAMVDVASRGRVGLALATGWMRRDFVLSEGSFGDRRELFEQRARELKQLWSGEESLLVGAGGETASVRLFPRPVTSDLPLWQASLGSPGSFHTAGVMGRGVLTNLIQQDISELAENIEEYKRGRAEAGLDPNSGHVTVLLHTSLTRSADDAHAVREDLVRYMTQTFQSSHADRSVADVSGLESRMEAAADRLLDGLSMIGTKESWRQQRAALGAIGVNEISCLIDFVEDSHQWATTVSSLGEILKAPVEVHAEQPLRARLNSSSELPGSGSTSHADDSLALARSALEVWAATKLSDESRRAYMIRRTFAVEGDVDVQRLREAYLEIAANQADLRLRVLSDGRAEVEPVFAHSQRCSFVLLDGRVADFQGFWANVEHHSGPTPVDSESNAGVALFVQSMDGGYALCFVASHVVLDGARFSQLVAEVCAVYEGTRPRRLDESDLRALSGVDPDEENRALEYWSRVAKEIPSDSIYTADSLGAGREGRRFHLRLPSQWLHSHIETARSHRVTPFVEALSAVSELLDELLEGPQLYAFPVAPVVPTGVGSQARMLPIWTNSADQTGRLELIRRRTLEAMSHSSITFRQIFEERRRSSGHRAAIIPTISFSWDSFADVRLGTGRIREVDEEAELVRFPLAVTLTTAPDGNLTVTLDVAHAFAEGPKAEALADVFFGRFRTLHETEPIEKLASLTTSSVGHALADLVAATRDGTEVAAWTDRTLELTGQPLRVDLIVAKARASAYVVHKRGCSQPSQITTRLGTPSEVLLATVVLGVLGLTYPRGGDAGTESISDGTTLELRGSATGVESGGGVEVVGLSAWSGVPRDFAFERASADAPVLVDLLSALAQSSGISISSLVAALEDLPSRQPSIRSEPANEVSTAVRNLWKSIFDDDAFDDEDDFFELGGDSISAIRFIGALNQELGRDEPVSLIFRNPTLRELIAWLTKFDTAGVSKGRALNV